MGGTEGARGIDGGKGRKKKKRWMDETINTATKEEGRREGGGETREWNYYEEEEGERGRERGAAKHCKS